MTFQEWARANHIEYEDDPCSSWIVAKKAWEAAQMTILDSHGCPKGERMSELAQGTFKCDICGQDTPHSHHPEDVETERFVRPAFEKTAIPRHRFGRIGHLPYSDGGTEKLWQHFLSGWFACKRHLAAFWNYEALPCAKCGGIHDGECRVGAQQEPQG